MRERAILWSAGLVLLVTLVVGASMYQYRTYTDPRTSLQKLDIQYGVAYAKGSPLETEPDSKLWFWQSEASFYVDLSITINNQREDVDSRSTTCYYIVPPGSELVDLVTVRQHPDLAFSSGGTQIAAKFDDHWIYQQPCQTPKPTSSSTSSTATEYGAAFTVSTGALYQSRFDQFSLEFVPIGAGGLGPVWNGEAGGDEDQFFNSLIDCPANVSYEIDGYGWPVNPHIPGSDHITHQTDSTIEVTAAGSGESQHTGTPSVTFTNPGQQVLLGLTITLGSLLLGVAVDRLFALRGRESGSAPNKGKPK